MYPSPSRQFCMRILCLFRSLVVIKRHFAWYFSAKLICARTGISREDAYTLCSLAADLRVTQVVNGAKGIHVMLEKKLLVRGK